MSSRLADTTPVTGTLTEPAVGRDAGRGLLDMLGLPASATPEQVRALRDELADHLASAPGALQPWAERQLALAEAALILVGGEVSASTATTRLGTEPTQLLDTDEPAALDVDGTEQQRPAVKRPAAARSGTRRPAKRTARGRRRNPLIVGGMVVVALALAVSVYFTGGKPGTNTAGNPVSANVGATTSAMAVDAKMVTTLEAKVKANPKDIESMRALGQIYFAAGLNQQALQWQQRILAVAPNDLEANLAAGVNAFDLSDIKAATRYWEAAVKIAPRSAEAHYNLGYAYLTQAPPDMAKAQREWETTVKLDPNSNIGKDAADKVSHLASAAASASASAKGK